jgi:hypothetical protein
MPRSSDLRFTQEQEKKLVEYLIQRRESLIQDNMDRVKIDAKAWERYNMDVRRRAAVASSIFPLSNLSIPVFPMVMEHFVSRCEDATVGEEPFFHFEAVGPLDEQKRLVYDRYFNWKLDQGKVHEALLESNLPLFIQRACIQKAAYAKDVAEWVDMDKRILFDRRTGEPVEILNHGPIIEDEDQFVEQVDPAAPAPAEGQPPTMRKHLMADPTFVYDETLHVWQKPPDGIKRSQMLYCGPKSVQVRFDRFFCPMDAASSDEADVVMELEDQPYHWFQEMWLDGRSWATWEQNAPNLSTGDTTPKTGQQGEVAAAEGARRVENRSFDHLNPLRRVALFWVRRDVLTDGKGKPQDFAVWMDLDLQVLVYYQWTAKLCPDMRRPYTVTSLCREPNRWCGRSIFERGEHLFDAVDRMFNGEFYRTLQQANPPKGGDPTVAVEEPDDIQFDPTKFYALKTGKTMDELLSYAKVPDTNQRTQAVLEFIIFWIQLWLGVSNIAQGDYAAVPENSTKYGIQKTLQEASMLGRRWIRRKINSDEDHLNKLVKIAIATMPVNREETYEYVDGDRRQMAVISGADIRTLNIHVTIVESQHHQENDIERANSMLAVQQRFFEQLNPEVRAAMRPLLVEIGQQLNYKNVEELLPDFTAMPTTASMMGGNPLETGVLDQVQGSAVPSGEQQPGNPQSASAPASQPA